MNLSDFFKSEENLQLEKKTLVFLRWIAIIGQLIAIYTVYFIFKFEFPALYCALIIFPLDLHFSEDKKINLSTIFSGKIFLLKFCLGNAFAIIRVLTLPGSIKFIFKL